jgi:hypothetical protein
MGRPLEVFVLTGTGSLFLKTKITIASRIAGTRSHHILIRYSCSTLHNTLATSQISSTVL